MVDILKIICSVVLVMSVPKNRENIMLLPKLGGKRDRLPF